MSNLRVIRRAPGALVGASGGSSVGLIVTAGVMLFGLYLFITDAPILGLTVLTGAVFAAVAFEPKS